MEETKRLAGCCSTVLICLLIIHALANSAIFFQIDQCSKRPAFPRILLKPNLTTILKPNLTTWDGNLGTDRKVNEDVQKQEHMKFLLRRLVKDEQWIEFEEAGVAYSSELNSDIYVSSKQVRFDTNTFKIYVLSDQELEKKKVQAYALKNDKKAMKSVKTVEIQSGNDSSLPPCNHIHDVPVVVFSSGGFAGNIFHGFNDIIIPLFITSRHFNSHIKFIVTDFKPLFIKKHKSMFKQLSQYDLINAAETESTANGTIHCFPGAVVGLKYHDNLAINSSETPGGYSMFDFRDVLRKSYHMKIRDVSQMKRLGKPVLLLISRRHSRKILNQDKVVKLMKEIGFRVVISSKESNLDKFANVVNSCHAMVGVHGAGLTNELFLPTGAVVIQVLPLSLDWPGNAYYGEPAKGMGLHYLEYKIDKQESSLYDRYGPDHPVIANPKSIDAQGYAVSRAFYLDQQNVKINIGRFRKTLVEAMRLLGRSKNPSN